MLPEPSPRQTGSLKTMAECSQSFEMESRLLRRNGTVVWMARSVSSLRDKDGSFQQATAIIVDTERKRSQDVKRRLAVIIASSNDAVLGIDLGVKITRWNTGAERLY